MHIDNRKELLYRTAFKMFLTKHFESVTISDIENATGMTRGAITYYAKNKMGLFKAVVKHYIIDKQNINYKFDPNQPTFKDFIDAYLNGVRCTMSGMQRLIDELDAKNASRSYLFLLFQIRMYFPDLHDEYLTNRNREMGIWTVKISEAIQRGELKPDIDIIECAEQYVYLFYGQALYDSLLSGLDVERLRRGMYNSYKLMKTKETPNPMNPLISQS